MTSVEEKLRELGVIPVAVIEDARNAISLAEALVAGGLPCVEVTFRTAAAKDAISAISSSFPHVLVGAGTVLSVEQAKQAVDSGARFVVAPGFDAELVDWCLEAGVDVFPGCATASEITQAYKRGIRTVKFFPCGQLGGLSAIEALAAPFSGLRFIPTGGINLDNVEGYLKSDLVLACGGSWVAPRMLISSGLFDEIAQRATSVCSFVRKIYG